VSAATITGTFMRSFCRLAHNPTQANHIEVRPSAPPTHLGCPAWPETSSRMTNASNFGMIPAHNGSPIERSALGDASVRVRRPTGFRPLAELTSGTAVGPSPADGDGLPRLWSPTASRALTVGRQNTTAGVRAGDIADVAAMFLPEELLPIVKGLSLGKPDVTVSRLLDMSPRKFSRKVAELLAYLEVETRFQAGAEVAHRWMLWANPR
jgi:hypothetical protein